MVSAADLKKHPLPRGVSDAVLNRKQLAQALGSSEPTIDRWIGEGMPVLERGTNGKAYQFQLSHCYAWRQLRETEQAAQDSQAENAVRQMRLALLGGDVGDSERALNPRERQAIYAAEVEWQKLARMRGEVIPAAEVTDLLQQVFSLVRAAINAMPDRLARDAGLTAAQVDQAEAVGDDILADMQSALSQHVANAESSDAQLLAEIEPA